MTKRTAIKDQILDRLRARNAFRGPEKFELDRVITRLRPRHKYSTSRSGKSVPIPDLYNLMVLKVSENSDIQKLCDDLSSVDGIEYAEPNDLMRITDSPPND